MRKKRKGPITASVFVFVVAFILLNGVFSSLGTTLTETFEHDKSTQQQDISYASDISSIPTYDGNPIVVLNDNQPDFESYEVQEATVSYETYAPLDSLGRCGIAMASIGQDIMPTEDRESISNVTPSGWENENYSCVDGGWTYNRCHLIGFQLAGENANERNLITGTRYMNVEGMLPYENMINDYVDATNNHVLYRVTPIFEGENLVASGVQLEARSVEDNGDGLSFNVYCYNVQPGITIDYATGKTMGSQSCIVQ